MESRTETINVFYKEKIHGNKFSFIKILSYTISGKKANPIMGFFLLTFVSIITITGFSSISIPLILKTFLNVKLFPFWFVTKHIGVFS